MSDLDTVLNNALAEGDVLKTAQLVNLSFTITALDGPHTKEWPAEFDKDGKETKSARTQRSYKATIMLDDEEQLAWLGGGWLTPQVDALMKNDLLPCRVKVITDTTKNGNPYILVAAQPGARAEGYPDPQRGTVPVYPVPSASNGTQTPAQRAADLFSAAYVSYGADPLIAAAMEAGAEDAVAFDGNGLLTLDPSKMALGATVKLITAIEALNPTERVPFE